MNELIVQLSSWMTGSIEATGNIAVFFLMVVESAGVPFPSEITMPFAGFLSASGRLSFWPAVVSGGLGNLVGSLIAYGLALYGGRPLIAHFHGLWFSSRDMAVAEKFFMRYGNLAVFIGRLLPVIRTYISFPAGLVQMKLLPFVIFTTIGSLLWSWFLTFLGLKLGSNWPSLRARFEGIELLIFGLVIAALAYFLFRHRHRRVA